MARTKQTARRSIIPVVERGPNFLMDMRRARKTPHAGKVGKFPRSGKTSKFSSGKFPLTGKKGLKRTKLFKPPALAMA